MNTSQYANMERGKGEKHIVLPCIMLALSIAASIAFSGLHGLAPLVSAVAYALFALRGYRNLQGMNGDISGYALTLGELMGIAVFVFVK